MRLSCTSGLEGQMLSLLQHLTSAALTHPERSGDSLMRLRQAGLIAIAALFTSALALHADPTTYNYTGKDFTVLFGPANPFTTSDFVTVSFTVSSALGANLVNET